MDKSIYVELTSQAILLVLTSSLPSIVVATVVGVVIALLQALTQIQDQTLGYAVKLIATVIVIVFFMDSVFGDLVRFALISLRDFPSFTR